MGEDRARVDQVEVTVLKREMGNDGGDGKVEGGLEILLAPENVFRLDVHPVDVAALGQIGEPSDQPPAAAAEVEDPLAAGDRMADASKILAMAEKCISPHARNWSASWWPRSR